MPQQRDLILFLEDQEGLVMTTREELVIELVDENVSIAYVCLLGTRMTLIMIPMFIHTCL